jgi:ribonucleoside-diphosphate reductase alpha chain
MTNTARKRLPDRREHELIDLEHGGFLYTAGIGRFEDGRLVEIFFNVSKSGTHA